MPNRPREMTNVPSEARIQQLIRSHVNQEVRRLLTDDDALAELVGINTSDIAANANAIASNDVDIFNAVRRIADEGHGLLKSIDLTSHLKDISIFRTTTFLSSSQWTLCVPSIPDVTTWSTTFTVMDSTYNGSAGNLVVFDSRKFDEQTKVLVLQSLRGNTYDTNLKELTLNWGLPVSGTAVVLNIGAGLRYSVIAISD